MMVCVQVWWLWSVWEMMVCVCVCAGVVAVECVGDDGVRVCVQVWWLWSVWEMMVKVGAMKLQKARQRAGETPHKDKPQHATKSNTKHTKKD